MTREEVEKNVKQIVSSMLGVPIVEMSHDLAADLAADFLDVTETVMSVEERFGVGITEEESDSIKTVKDICDIVCKKLQIS